ncbi:MAG: GspL/Epsl periplasmic domain-containing protein [Desulfocapsaceae bacterium]|nr:GspL/Epsl periplasmic domain-containing protein [Desulfocapsaceae bacterium]
MAQRLLSLDIRAEVVCAVMLSRSKKPPTVVGCGISVPVGDNIVQALEEVLQQVKYNGEPCRVSFGAEHFYFRNLTFPFSDKRKIDKILTIELEDQVLVDMDKVIADSLVTGQKEDSAAVVAAMVDRSFLRQRLDELAALGIDPNIVAVSSVQTALQLSRNKKEKDFVLLDVGCQRFTMFVMAAGQMRLVRTMVFDDGNGANYTIDKNSQQISARRPNRIAETFKTMGKDINHTLFALEDAKFDLPIYLTGALAGVKDSRQHLKKNLGRRVIHCDLAGINVEIGPGSGLWRVDLMTAPLALGLRASKKQSGFNFRKDEFAKKANLSKYRKLAPQIGVSIAVVLVLTIGYLWNDYYNRKNQLQALEQQSREIFSQTLPEVSRIVDPVQQLTVKVRELKQGALGDNVLERDIRVLDMLAELSTQIPETLQVQIVRMVVDDQGLLLRGLTDNFNSVDGLKRVLEKSAYFSVVTINSANLATRGTGVRFELKLELNRG